MNLPKVEYQVLYDNKDITADISADIISLDYTDKVANETDEISLTLHDKYKLWQNNWYPQKGASLQLIIRKELQQLDCGKFEIDETGFNYSTSGSIFTMKALAAGISKKMRTVKVYAHENKSLREIANTVATSLGLTLAGNVQDIRIQRVHQYKETDLGFLNRIASAYGYVFSVRANQLIFTYYKDIETRAASFILNATDITSFSGKDTTFNSFKTSRVRCYNQQKKEKVEFKITETDTALLTDREDDYESFETADNKQQAESKAGYALHKNNSNAVTADIALPGNLLCVSGNNVELRGVGYYSGIYHIVESSHNISRDGSYASSAQIKRVKLIDKSLY